MLKALLLTHSDVERVMRNKKMLRDTRIYIARDYLPYQWGRVLGEMEKRKREDLEKQRRETQEKREQKEKERQEGADQKEDWLKNAPRTELFSNIYEQLVAEKEARGRPGNERNRGDRRRTSRQSPPRHNRRYQERRDVRMGSNPWSTILMSSMA